MQTSPAGIVFIEDNEGFSATPYPDNGAPSWGYGHHQRPGENVPSSVTREQAEALLLQDMALLETYLTEAEPTLSQNQFDALVDFGYNLGMGALQTMLGHGLDQVPIQIPRWNHVNGVVSPGLTARRQAETDLFTTQA
jgi:lysozyme